MPILKKCQGHFQVFLKINAVLITYLAGVRETQCIEDTLRCLPLKQGGVS